jgi:flagellar hook-length control protein FliK
METIAVAPVATPVQPQASAPQAPQENGAERPFEHALKQELTKPETAKAKAERADAEKPQAAKAVAPAKPQPTDVSALSPELAAMLESAGLVDGEEPLNGAETAELADALAGQDAADPLATAMPAELPVQPLMAPPTARVESTLVALAQERQVETTALELKTREDLPQSGAAQPEGLDDAAAQATSHDTKPEAPSTLLAALAERTTTTETSAFSGPSGSTLDSLASASFVGRWTQAQATSAEAAAAAPASARIDTPIGEKGWGAAFQQKIIWLVDRQQQSAELHVNPPHLGPVDVVLNMSEDGATLAFSSPHAAVREAIEASLGDLRESLEERGLSLGEAFVSADSKEAREQLQGEARQGGRQNRGGSVEAMVAETLPAPRIQRGLVDLFA